MSDEIKLGDIVVFKTDNRAFEVIGKYIVPDDRLWRVEAITEDDPPTSDRNRKYRLVAVDCPNVMLDEIPEIYVESYSEKLERELEEQRKEALKMKRKEIKQGDKVRVSKDAPHEIIKGKVIPTAREFIVTAVGRFYAEIKLNGALLPTYFCIPTKYLVKVDAEAKEAKFKVDDWVKIGETPNSRLNGRVGTISQIDKEGYEISFNDGFFTVVSEEDLTLADEPTEQTEAEKKPYDGLSEETANEISDMLEAYAKALSGIADPFDWQRYEADLAKEVALKVANKFNAPHEAAEYAVSVAKAVVEGLKRK